MINKFFIDKDGPLGSRFFTEENQPDTDKRDPFNHDRDRILHSTAFRRLQYKTQVYATHEGDLYRTRMTHTLEVAQIARGIATHLQLPKENENLCEAIALAHDIGHSPFGHTGEGILNTLLEEHGRHFEHNVQSYRMVSRLEQKYSTFQGFNLTKATLSGIIRHQTPFDETNKIKTAITKDISTEVAEFFVNPQPILEAQIVNLADMIAYAAHDSEDALAVGLINWNDFESKLNEAGIKFYSSAIHARLSKRENKFNQSFPNNPETLKKTKNRWLSWEIINHLVQETVKETTNNLSSLDNNDKNALVNHSKPIVCLPESLNSEIICLVKDVLFNSVYQDYRVKIMASKAERIIKTLFEEYMANPKTLPKITQSKLPPEFIFDKGKRTKDQTEELAQVVVDFIAGMTDKYAMDTYQIFTQAYEKTL
ncbi:metal-dependent phosphohydrolase [Dehalococcoides mccartyi]|uniref:Deoxyguanosinetriphosphate triphosphohydrolase-like protein n=1 Tax=Dehalococcoides mccartyi TaxID=61435 RepID=A0A2J1DU70_9CHLR|nr:metal-dependent phosphohydrolase [Dehalococcoides mccartyi]